jgi:xanthine dehydrogenase YagT iron-sulfur-binding subunit
MQQAFIDHDTFQSGYCAPGQIMSAVACVHEAHAENDVNISEYTSGDLCRWAAYPNIAAIDQTQASTGNRDMRPLLYQRARREPPASGA